MSKRGGCPDRSVGAIVRSCDLSIKKLLKSHVSNLYALRFTPYTLRSVLCALCFSLPALLDFPLPVLQIVEDRSQAQINRRHTHPEGTLIHFHRCSQGRRITYLGCEYSFSGQSCRKRANKGVIPGKTA
jgi:hypothetical protein